LPGELVPANANAMPKLGALERKLRHPSHAQPDASTRWRAAFHRREACGGSPGLGRADHPAAPERVALANHANVRAPSNALLRPYWRPA